MKYIFANLKNNSVSKEYFKILSKIKSNNNVIVFPKRQDLRNIKTDIVLGLQNFENNDINNYKEYDYVLLGHHDYNETCEIINKKIKNCIEYGYNVLVCSNSFEDLKKDLNEIKSFDNIIIAYEPDKYIGTGNIIKVDEIEKFIDKVKKEYGNSVKIVYGGGININNLNKLKKLSNLDGLLLGTSSLDIDCFKEIINGY